MDVEGRLELERSDEVILVVCEESLPELVLELGRKFRVSRAANDITSSETTRMVAPSVLDIDARLLNRFIFIDGLSQSFPWFDTTRIMALLLVDRENLQSVKVLANLQALIEHPF